MGLYELMRTRTNKNSNNLLLANLLNDKDEVTISLKEEFPTLLNRLIDFKFSVSDDSKVHEAFCLYAFLISCFKLGLLGDNITISKTESPDFVIKNCDGKLDIGLEHTCATIGCYQIARKEYSEGCLLELCQYSPFKHLSNKQADIGIIQPGDKPKGKGWKGNEAEEEWTETMIQTINRKVATLNKSHFQQKQVNHLIVEDATPVDFVIDKKTAFEMLRDRYTKAVCSKSTPFHKIHILSNDILLYDFFGKVHEIDIHKAQLKEFTDIKSAQSNPLSP